MYRIIILVLLMILPGALADIYTAADFTGDGLHSSSSEGPDARLYSSTTGPVEYSQIFDLKQGKYRTWAGLNGSGDFSVSSPEYDMDIRGAKDLYVTAAMNRETQISSTVEEMEAELSQIAITQFLAHRSNIEITARGNGNLTEDIRVGSSTDKSGMLHLWDFDFVSGNFSLNRTLKLDGNTSRTSFRVLEEGATA